MSWQKPLDDEPSMPRKRLLPLSQTEGFLTDETQRAKYISRILKPLEHFYFYISYTCVECGKDMMSYFASSWKKKNRGMFSANRTKHLILDLVKFNPGKFFIPCLLKSTDKRLFVLLFFSVFVELFSSFVWDCLLFLSLRSIFQRSNRLIMFNFQNTTDFALCLTKTSMQRV